MSIIEQPFIRLANGRSASRHTALPVAGTAKPPLRQRTKLWELNDSVHCSIIGTCLTTGELRRVMGKAMAADVSHISDHDLHARAVGLCSRHNTSSKLLHKALDARHEAVIKRFARLEGEAAAMQARFAIPAWEAVGVSSAADLPLAASGVDGLLLDAKAPSGSVLPGGNARTFDWSVMQGWTAPIPWLLAGGLTPGNVRDAVRISGAPAVDVSSGVERSRGVKDPELIRAFIRNAKSSRDA